ncbi:MAG: quinone-dependent dihydroorotate dehydrogenase [Prevotellaceae bacterium]|jgi:dihydroorotate dehydrogenase|nr:quinone-dependent dihydroorotate dehydrogenase [Prevotellaceae bacterium]
MYKLFRPILFLFSPESIHHIIVFMMKVVGYIPCLSYLLRKHFTISDKRLERELFNIKFSNPVGLAAGFDKNAEVFSQMAMFGFGFIEIGTVTPLAQKGNARPRCFRLPADKAIINRMGFNNKGVEVAAKRLHKKRKHGLIIGGNIGKNTATSNENANNDYNHDFTTLYDYVDYFVVNISCPNINNLRELQNKDELTALLTGLVEERRFQDEYKPILLKISPDLSFEQIDETLDIIDKIGIDGIVATNTTTSRKGLKASTRKIEKIGNGGLSGTPLAQRSLEIVRYIDQKTGSKLPIIGVGGIMTVQDAINMLNAGASLVQVYTGFIYEGPGFVKQINRRLLQPN